MAEPHPHGVHRYRSVTEGVAMANEYLSSRLSISEFARQKGVSFKMVKYWTAVSVRRPLRADPCRPLPYPDFATAAGVSAWRSCFRPARCRSRAGVTRAR
jgi:hypothetical protein